MKRAKNSMRCMYGKQIMCMVQICCLFGSAINAQGSANEPINIAYESILKTRVPLLKTINPAVVHYFPLDSFIDINAGYENHEGAFKTVYEADQKTDYLFTSKGFKRVKKVMLLGEFEYNRVVENGKRFRNIYNERPVSPYVFVDTMSSEKLSKEQFMFKGSLSYHMAPKLILGTKISYMAGVGAQTRDPRALNKVSNSTLQLGLVSPVNTNTTVGVSICYNYFNEDIEVNVVEKNATYFLFGLTGLGTYSKHESGKFYRLYKQHQVGGNFQFEYKQHLVSLDYAQSLEDVFDGRRESGASWSAIKHDSEFQHRKLFFQYTLTVPINLHIHQLSLEALRNTYVGTEILQNLEKVDDTYDVYQWVTYQEEEKYSKQNSLYSLDYRYSAFRSKLNRNYTIRFKADFCASHQNYYWPNLSLSYSNARLALDFSKYIKLKKSGLELTCGVMHNKNIENDNKLSYQSAITRLMILPDYQYYTADYWQGGVALTYDFLIKKRSRMYVKGSCTYKQNENEALGKRRFYGISLGAFI